jgi:alpha-mannosidase
MNPAHSGSVVNSIKIKHANREIESMVYDIESMGTMIKNAGGKFSCRETDPVWTGLAKLQAHDGIYGVTNGAVYEENMRDFIQLKKLAAGIRKDIESRLAVAVTSKKPGSKPGKWLVINTLPYERSEKIRLDENMYLKSYVVPAMGWKLLSGENVVKVKPDESTGSRHCIENEFYAVRFDKGYKTGEITYKPDNFTGVLNPLNVLCAEEDVGCLFVTRRTGKKMFINSGTIKFKCIKKTNLFQSVSFTGRLTGMPWNKQAVLNWDITITLYKGDPKIEYTVNTDWHGNRTFVSARIKTPINKSEGYFEVPFGVVKRVPPELEVFGYRSKYYAPPPPAGSAKDAFFEWETGLMNKKGKDTDMPTYRFCSVDNGKFGVTVINTGNPGNLVKNGEISVSLFRSPTETSYGVTCIDNVPFDGIIPDIRKWDNGPLTTRFFVMIHKHGWQENRVPHHSQMIHQPLVVIPVSTDNIEETANLCIEPNNVIMTAFTRTRDDKYNLVRIYETCGKKTKVNISVSAVSRAYLADLRERPVKPIKPENNVISYVISPFEIATIIYK